MGRFLNKRPVLERTRSTVISYETLSSMWLQKCKLSFSTLTIGLAEYLQIHLGSHCVLCDLLDRVEELMVGQFRTWLTTYGDWNHHGPTPRTAHKDKIHVYIIYHVVDRGQTAPSGNSAHFDYIACPLPASSVNCSRFCRFISTANSHILLPYIFRRIPSPQANVAIFGSSEFNRERRLCVLPTARTESMH